MSELLKYAIKGGATTIITETSELATLVGHQAIMQLLKVIKNQPIKVFMTASPMVTISPATEERAITADELRKLFRRKEVIGLGEAYWAQVVNGNQRILELMSETLNAGKRLDGHSSGAKDNRLQAYIASGVSSCHEPITAEEVLERLQVSYKEECYVVVFSVNE